MTVLIDLVMEVHEKVLFYITITNKAQGKHFSEYCFWENGGHS